MAEDPYTFGPSSFGDQSYTFGAADPNAVDPVMSGTGGGTDWKGIADALKGLSSQSGQQQSASQPAAAQAGQVGSGQASSAAYQGSPAGMNALVQMLMAKADAYRQAANPRTAAPVNLMAQNRPAGLLGL